MLKRVRIALTALLLLAAVGVNAQVTTASMAGKVTDASNEPIIGATVQAVHQPSGSRYGTVTNVDGRYSIQGMRTGGPYRVEISYIGYQTVIYKDITLQLGEVYNLNVETVSYTHLRAHETGRNLVCRLLLEKKKEISYAVFCLKKKK